MQRRVKQKWRPPLALVIGGTLAAVLCLPLIGIAYFRLAGNILGWSETAWLIFWMAFAATALLAWLLWRLVLRPVYALTNHAKAVTAGESTALPSKFGTPEFSGLAQSLETMAATLQNREAGIRAYSDHVTHELKSPLTSITAAAELLQSEGLSQDDRSELARSISLSAKRMNALLGELRRLASAREPFGRGPTQVSKALQAIDAPLSVTLEADVSLPLGSTSLEAILTQFLSNSAAHGARSVTLTGHKQSLILQDDGPGIPTGNRARIFDPFFTTQRESGGTGMGLAVVRAMVEAHGGEARLLPSERGARFEVRF